MSAFTCSDLSWMREHRREHESGFRGCETTFEIFFMKHLLESLILSFHKHKKWLTPN